MPVNCMKTEKGRDSRSKEHKKENQHGYEPTSKDKAIINENKAYKKLTCSAIFAVFAAVVGVLEGFLPLSFVIPVPGVKLGIANVFVILAYALCGPLYALGVSAARVIIVFIFSGNPVSLLLSVTGAAASFAGLVLTIRGAGKIYSFAGVSSFCAFLHGFAQLAAASALTGTACFYYLPVMCFLCAAAGVFTGILANLLSGPAKLILNLRAI